MGRSLPSTTLMVLAVFAVTGGIVWLAYSEAGTVYGNPPLIEAAAAPLKRSPTDPGGREVAELGGVGELLQEPEGGSPEEQLMPSPERPLSPAEVAVANLTEGGSIGNLEPNPEIRNQATAALEAMVDEIANDGLGSSSGAGGPATTSPKLDEQQTAALTEILEQTLKRNEPEARGNPGLSANQDELANLESGLDADQETRFQGTPGGRFRVQLAAVREEEDARRAWSLFEQQLGPRIVGLEPFFERASTDNGIFYRVQIGPFADSGEANSLCLELQKQDTSCFVVSR